MAFYVTKPERVEAMQFTRNNFQELVEFTGGIARDMEIERRIDGKCTCLLVSDDVNTFTPLTYIGEGDYVIKKPKGGFRALTKRSFERMYFPEEVAQ